MRYLLIISLLLVSACNHCNSETNTEVQERVFKTCMDSSKNNYTSVKQCKEAAMELATKITCTDKEDFFKAF